ncbi:uncharacterized protein SPAPADRAFT_61293, partial [Spathaspora passalidarum NRRL Y-27907]
MYMNRHYKKLIFSSLFLIALLSSVVYILQPKPFTPPDIQILDYPDEQDQGINQKIANVITDVRILKCNNYKCKVPGGYQQILPQLNYYTQKVSRTSMYSYYVIVKKQPIKSTTRAIVDLDIVPQDEDYEEVAGGTSELKLYKRSIVINMSKQIPKDLPLVRSIEALFGTNDLVDSREHHSTLHLSNDESIHPILSVFKLSQDKEKDFFEKKKSV